MHFSLGQVGNLQVFLLSFLAEFLEAFWAFFAKRFHGSIGIFWHSESYVVCLQHSVLNNYLFYYILLFLLTTLTCLICQCGLEDHR